MKRDELAQIINKHKKHGGKGIEFLYDEILAWHESKIKEILDGKQQETPFWGNNKRITK